MDTDAQKQFVTALNYLLEKQGRGAQARLANETKIDRGFLNAIVKGRSPGPQEKKEKIAGYFNFNYEDMLSLGRYIINNGTADGWSKSPQRQIEDYDTKLAELDKQIELARKESAKLPDIDFPEEWANKAPSELNDEELKLFEELLRLKAQKALPVRSLMLQRQALLMSKNMASALEKARSSLLPSQKAAINKLASSPKQISEIIDTDLQSLDAYGNSNNVLGPNISGQVPLISWDQAGAWTDFVDTFQPGVAEEWVIATKKVSDNAFALRIIGDSMKPEFLPGEIIIVDPAVKPKTGKYVIAKIDNGNGGEDGEATFKQFVRDGNQVYLKPLNDKYPLIDMTGNEYRIVGCVVEKRKEF